MGGAIALTYVKRGDSVLVVGRDPDRGRAFLKDATAIGAGRASFIAADVSLIEENRRLIDEVGARFATVDALVLCARHYRSVRAMTGDGLEATFASFYLSRFLLSHGLIDRLDRADAPVIVNVAGPGGTASIQWDDLGLAAGYHGSLALGQGGRLNDLLGVAFAELHPSSPTRYVLFHPGVVATTFSGEYDAADQGKIVNLQQVGLPIDEAVAPIVAIIDQPPREPLSAELARYPLGDLVLADDLRMRGTRIGLDHSSFDVGAALRLHALTTELLARRA
jgi:NAD(P)-dependent dehydrogenase (short-subunit alcohol dehydrogenase family)